MAAAVAVAWSSLVVAALPAPTAHTNRPPENGPGITYAHEEVKDVPWSVHIVKVDRSHGDIHFETTLGLGNHQGMARVTDQVKLLPSNWGRPLAAINGDFYKINTKYEGDPEGLQIMRGELISAPRPTHSCFWIDGAGNPHVTNVQGNFIATLPDGSVLPFGLNEERSNDELVLYTAANGASTRTSGGVELVLTQGTATNWLPLRAGQTYNATVKHVKTQGDAPLSRNTMVLSAGSKLSPSFAKVKAGDVIKIATTTKPDVGDSPIAIGGGPALVRGGKAITFTALQRRDPRSALGWNKDYYFLVEVDGRQKESAGMTFPELANYMQKLGCEEAINLDGGGSATLWVYGNIMNSPSEGRERPAANALVVLRKDRD